MPLCMRKFSYNLNKRFRCRIEIIIWMRHMSCLLDLPFISWCLFCESFNALWYKFMRNLHHFLHLMLNTNASSPLNSFIICCFVRWRCVFASNVGRANMSLLCMEYLHFIPLIFYNLFILHIYGDKVNILSLCMHIVFECFMLFDICLAAVCASLHCFHIQASYIECTNAQVKP